MSASDRRGPLWRAATGIGVVSTDGEGWEILWVWVLGAFGGIAIAALVGLVLGLHRRPAAETPFSPRLDAS